MTSRHRPQPILQRRIPKPVGAQNEAYSIYNMLSVFSKSPEEERLKEVLGVIYYGYGLPFIRANGEKCDMTQPPLNAGAYRYWGWQDWKWSRNIFMTSFIYTIDGTMTEVNERLEDELTTRYPGSLLLTPGSGPRFSNIGSWRSSAT